MGDLLIGAAPSYYHLRICPSPPRLAYVLIRGWGYIYALHGEKRQGLMRQCHWLDWGGGGSSRRDDGHHGTCWPYGIHKKAIIVIMLVGEQSLRG